MAYPVKIRNAAMRLWISGFSYDKVVPRLAKQFPDEKTPQHARIIQQWHHRDDWKSLADAADREVRENVVKKIAKELEAEEHRDKTTIEAILQQIRYQLTQKTKDNKPVILDPLAISQLVSSIDRAIRRKRINRLGYDTITHKEVTGKIETHNESVVITADVSAKVSSIGRNLALGMSPDVVE